jgi:tetratricopeptide (TPR) repeat protein
MTGWLLRIALVASSALAALVVSAHAATYSEADTCYANGEWVGARARYQQIATATPADSHAWLGLARSCCKLNDWQAAVEAYGSLLALGPANASIRTEYGDALRQLGRLREAVEQYSVALEGAPEDQASLDAMSQADDWYTTGEMEKAREAYADIISKYPKNLLAWLRLARIHTEASEYPEAIMAFEEIDKRGGMNPEVRLEYGDLLKKAGKLDEAINQYELSLAGKEPDVARVAAMSPAGRTAPECGIDDSDIMDDSLLYLAEKATAQPVKFSADNITPVELVRSKKSQQVEPSSSNSAVSNVSTGKSKSASKTTLKSAGADNQAQAREVTGEGESVQLSSFRPYLKSETSAAPRETAGKGTTFESTPADGGEQAAFQTRSAVPPPGSAHQKRSQVNGESGSFYVGRSEKQPAGLNSLFNKASSPPDRLMYQEKKGSEPAPTGDWLDQAKKLSAEKRWAEAVYAFQQLMKERDLNIDEMLQYGDALAENRDVDEAEAIFNTVLHDDATNVDAKLGLAKVLAYSGKLDEAMYLLDQVQDSADSARTARLARAKAYFANDYIQETWRDIGELLANEPGNQDIVDMINSGAPWPEIKALLQSRPGNEEIVELIEKMNKAGLEQLGFMPTDDAARAEQLFYQGDFDEALKQFEQILRTDPNNLTALKRSGDIYRWDGRWQDALWAYEQYIDQEPDDPEAVLRHAEIVLYNGDADEAAQEFWLLITNPDLDPELYEQAVSGYAIALGSVGRHDEALEWFVEALTLNPDNSETRVAYADALAAMRRYNDAFEQYDLVIQSDPDFTGAIYGKARAYSWMGDQKSAQGLYDRVINEERWYVPARVGKAYSLLWSGQRGAALALAQEAAAVRSEDPEVAQLLARLGETPPPVLTTGKKKTHDSEDNDYTGNITQLIVPLSSRGTQVIVEHEDFKLDNTKEAEESAGTNTRLTLTTPMGHGATLSVNTSHLSVDNAADPGISTWNWGMGMHTDPLKDWAGGVSYNEYTMYETTQIARHNVAVKETQMYGIWQLSQNTSLLASYAWADFSDGNSRSNLLLKANRRIFYAGRGTLNYGLSNYSTGYKHPSTSGYWDPRRYRLTEVYVDWLDGSNRRWMFDGGAGVGYASDAENGSNWTTRYNVGVRTRALHENTLVRTGYEYNEAGTNATNSPNYQFGAWYLTAEYDF